MDVASLGDMTSPALSVVAAGGKDQSAWISAPFVLITSDSVIFVSRVQHLRALSGVQEEEEEGRRGGGRRHAMATGVIVQHQTRVTRLGCSSRRGYDIKTALAWQPHAKSSTIHCVPCQEKNNDDNLFFWFQCQEKHVCLFIDLSCCQMLCCYSSRGD